MPYVALDEVFVRQLCKMSSRLANLTFLRASYNNLFKVPFAIILKTILLRCLETAFSRCLLYHYMKCLLDSYTTMSYKIFETNSSFHLK